MLSFTCLTCILFVSAFALEAHFYDLEEAEQLFEEFIEKHGKSYQHPQEKALRLRIFKEKLNEINEKNARSSSAVFGVNYYSDLSQDEIKNHMCLFHLRNGPDQNCINVTDVTTNNAPKSIDWVKLGAVTSVKNQDKPLRCGSCYAFSTIGNIEGQYFIKNKKLLEFSVQEIVDCSANSDGCGGGFMSTAINDLKKLGGVMLNSTYPYVAEAKTCRFDSSKVVARVKGCTLYKLKDENMLKEVVAKRGPVSIAVSTEGLVDYKSGVLTRDDCPGVHLGHAMLLVGYGTDDKGTDYWLVKNTSGPEWGENGYVKFARGQNTCNFFNQFITSADLL